MSPTRIGERRPRRRRRLLLALLATAASVAGLVTVTSATANARPSSHDPYGHVKSVHQISARYYRVTGWAVDNDSAGSMRIAVTVDGRARARATANQATPRVPASAGNHTGAHGFAVNVRVPLGTHRFCVVVANLGHLGHKQTIGCRTRTLANNPEGNLLVRQIPGGVNYIGAAWDPNDTHAQIDVTMQAGGKQVGGVHRANLRGHHGHGFRGSHLMPAGTYNVCVVGKNVGWGVDAPIGCQSITLDYSPVGAITALTQTPNGLQVGGWATDPDTTDPVTVSVYDNGTLLGTTVANRSGTVKNGHQFSAAYPADQGKHTICLRGANIDFGQDRKLVCQTITLNYNPTATITALTQTMTGIGVVGTAVDPDGSTPVVVKLTLDGAAAGTATANLGAQQQSFKATLPTADGQHTVCAVAVNQNKGTGNSAKVCQSVTLDHDPIGAFESIGRSPSDPTQLTVSGWALDQGTSDPITVSSTLDGKPGPTGTADGARPDIGSKYPGYGDDHGFSFTIPADAGEHTVCLTAVNVGDGSDTTLGCQLIIAVNPKPPSAPLQVTGVGGYGGATVTWAAPASDGGAPPSSYVVTSSPGKVSVTADAGATSAVLVGLKPKTKYTFSVVAVNVAGTSPAGVSAAVTTQAAPPPQTSPAPVSTSRYIRNISSGSAAELKTMRSEGATDAYYNPSGHGYLVLLDIGGQDSYDGGVVLSATTKFVPYPTLVADIKAYVDGYASNQKPSAPVTIAIGTNNDMDVTKAAGRDWANKVVDPIVAYAAKYPGITIAGANDIEPGFRGTYAQTATWLKGYLAATGAPFVNNGSADGCSWTQPNKHCNNGWTMTGLYQLSGGLAPTRILNLPQIYNTTMPKQWKYISLTGVNAGQPRINFVGPLTEWTACDQSRSCGSITGSSAWQQLWNQLQSATALKVPSLPYSTDLRIDR